MIRSMMLPATAAAVALATPALAADEAAARLGAYDDAVIAIMKAKLPLATRIDRFQALVARYYDMPAIAALVVGPGWSGTSTGDRAAAIAALTRHSAISLARNFASYGGERFTVDPNVVTRGGSRIVRLTISSSGSRDTLLYRMQQGEGGWRIVDVVAGGVSQLAVQRADLASTVASGGAAGLARRLAQIDAKVR